jgi:hypothetical protein
MKRLAFALMVIPACVGGERADTNQCPAGETCSPETPAGLQFIGTSLLGAFVVDGPLATAIGGTQEIQLDEEPALAVYTPFDLAYTVDDDGGLGVRFDHQSQNVVTVSGVASRANYMRIVDPTTNELFDRKMLDAAQIDSISLVPVTADTVPAGMHVAWASGRVDVGIALSGQVQESTGPSEERLVDTSMVATLDGATQRGWDALELANAAPGSYPLSVTAGNLAPMTIGVDVVDAPDALAAVDPQPTVSEGDDVCFAATNAGRFVAGLVWSFTINGVTTAGTGNCVNTDQHLGNITVSATAGGKTATIEMTIVQAAHVSRPRHARQHRPTAGERAAM